MVGSTLWHPLWYPVAPLGTPLHPATTRPGTRTSTAHRERQPADSCRAHYFRDTFLLSDAYARFRVIIENTGRSLIPARCVKSRTQDTLKPVLAAAFPLG